uniref:G-protein coupled receptors family 1 profile domain-containing protein n=1 Tax=Haplochromis burtoni TaxID=8153 RepID=A0A3Q2W8Z1_HAPBU
MGQVPITYYTNLLISNLIQFSALIFFLIFHSNHALYRYIFEGIFFCAVFANLDFKMCIATERYLCLVITRPQWNCIRQTKGSVLLSVLVWILSIITVPLAVFFYVILLPVLIFFALVPFFLFIFTLVWTLKTLPAVTSVPTEEKQKIVGILVLLLVNHCLMFLPLIILYIVSISLYFLGYFSYFSAVLIYMNLFLFNPFMDVILVFLIWKDPIDNQLLSLCCYTMDNTAGEVAADKKLQLQCCSDCNSTVVYTALQQM